MSEMLERGRDLTPEEIENRYGDVNTDPLNDCGNQDNEANYSCNRVKNHSGDHVATAAGVGVVAAWPQNNRGENHQS